MGLRSGKLVAYQIRDHSKDNPPGYSAATFLWAWQTGGMLSGRPLPANRLVAFGSQDSRLYVAFMEEDRLLYRFLTGGPISASLAGIGTRTILVPSEDNNLYAVDLFNGEARWVHATGAPIKQEPLVADKEIFVSNVQGLLSSIEIETGASRWEMSSGSSQLIAVSPTRIYLQSADGDLIIVDRATGRLIADSAGTLDRAGLKLRDFTLAPTNYVDDRLYFSTPSGYLVSLREAGKLQPTLLRDPQALPFGSIPDGTENQTPPVNPPAEDQPEGAPGGFDPTFP